MWSLFIKRSLLAVCLTLASWLLSPVIFAEQLQESTDQDSKDFEMDQQGTEAQGQPVLTNSSMNQAHCVKGIEELAQRLAVYTWYNSESHFGSSFGPWVRLNTRAWAQTFSDQTGIATRFLTPAEELLELANIQDNVVDLTDQNICSETQIQELDKIYREADQLAKQFQEFDRDFFKNNLLIGVSAAAGTLVVLTGGLILANRNLRKAFSNLRQPEKITLTLEKIKAQITGDQKNVRKISYEHLMTAINTAIEREVEKQ